MNLIIDTDMGIDDAVALLMVLAQPQARLVGLTTVLGNISLAQATHNAGVVLDVAQAPDLPFYQGCARPLLQHPPIDAADVHGADGLGGRGGDKTDRSPRPEHASLALIRLAQQYAGNVTLLTLGPLTNVALAIRLDPQFLGQFSRVVVMGGAIAGRGNTSAAAEFNVRVDPPAAKIVFQAAAQAGLQLELISWETTLHHGLSLELWESFITGHSGPALLARDFTIHLKKLLRREWSTVLWPDPLAAAVALAPDIVLSAEPRFVEVVAGSGPAYGQTIVDYRLRSTQPPNARLIHQVDTDRFHALLRRAIAPTGE